jgi:L-fuconolactonase
MDDETALDPDIEICDPHHHLWEYPQSVYLVDDLKADTAGLNVKHTVFVECASAYRTDGPEPMRPVGESGWVHDLSPDGYVAGIVGFADLTLGDAVADVLDAHVAAGGGRFRGIRHVSAFDASPEIRPSHTNPPPDLFQRPDFREGFAALGRAGLSFDAWLYFKQLPELIDVADANPDVVIVLDHLGGPLGIGPYRDRRDEVLAEWRSSMTKVARRENVVLKLGGIGMPVYGMDWHRRDVPPTSEEVASVWGPPIRWCIEQFGPDRCMFESNFPVDRASFGYKTCWNSFVRMAADYSDDERQALFRKTAERAYRLS